MTTGGTKFILGAAFVHQPKEYKVNSTAPFSPEMAVPWADSALSRGYTPVLFTDAHCPYVPGMRMFHRCEGYPHTYRFVLMAEFLKKQNFRGEVWCTDVRDVVMINTPQPKSGFIYVGSELDDNFDRVSWFEDHAAGCPFWSDIKLRTPVYNCGIIGGVDILDFMIRLGELNSVCTGLNDMLALNYALQDMTNVVTGPPVHSTFGRFAGTTEWFRHK